MASAINDLISGINSVQNGINGNTPLSQSSQEQYQADGFLIPATFTGSNNGLPYTNTVPFQPGVLKRNIISWFIPTFGIVKMFVNPSSIQYRHQKIISKDLTKGGFSLQYHSEDLSTLNIGGTTGSSGIEGINVLYQIYRAEQYAFDATGLSLAANDQPDVLNSLIGSGSSTSVLNGNVSGIGNAIGSLIGLNSGNQSLLSENINSLAQNAFTVECYYNGIVYRGYFNNMNITESAQDFMFQYQMEFTVTQTRGMRSNYFGWNKSPNYGASSYTTPYSFNGIATVGQ